MRKIGMLAAFLAIVSVGYGQQTPPSPRVTAEGKSVKVSYGQPSKRGREIFGTLVPYGQVWRTGANEATEITFAKDTQFGGKPVKAGTYTLFTIPNEKEWTVILNSVTGQSGAFDYEKNKGKDVLSVKAPVQKLSSPTEKFTIQVTDNALKILWDSTSASVALK